MRQSDTHGHNKAQQQHIFAPVDGALIDRLTRLISHRGVPTPNDGTDQSSVTPSRTVPTLRDMLQRRS